MPSSIHDIYAVDHLHCLSGFIVAPYDVAPTSEASVNFDVIPSRRDSPSAPRLVDGWPKIVAEVGRAIC